MKDYRIWNYMHYVLIGVLGLGLSIMASIDYHHAIDRSNLYGIELTESGGLFYIIGMYVFSFAILLYGSFRIYQVRKKKKLNSK